MDGEKVLLRVSPMKGMMRFGKKDKLSPWHIGLFEVLERVGDVAYGLGLIPSLSEFISSVQLDENLDYEKEPMAILDMQVRKLRSKDIASVKIVGLVSERFGSKLEHFVLLLEA
ncbi:uncharacterized protein [Nicotiana tomentosiformis]|uniref:uncharacterized protein n=1 Tax=Nicotiana tomentosiformis TaxID=4098 RepID=UPI00388CECE2